MVTNVHLYIITKYRTNYDYYSRLLGGVCGVCAIILIQETEDVFKYLTKNNWNASIKVLEHSFVVASKFLLRNYAHLLLSWFLPLLNLASIAKQINHNFNNYLLHTRTITQVEKYVFYGKNNLVRMVDGWTLNAQHLEMQPIIKPNYTCSTLVQCIYILY